MSTITTITGPFSETSFCQSPPTSAQPFHFEKGSNSTPSKEPLDKGEPSAAKRSLFSRIASLFAIPSQDELAARALILERQEAATKASLVFQPAPPSEGTR